jgi:hypothetical protein
MKAFWEKEQFLVYKQLWHYIIWSMYSSILKLDFTYNELLHVSVNYVDVIADIKYENYNDTLEE